ncbi:MAG TPA: endonuclease VII domain-containing protein, partial [Rhabdochlamydiaceae bacterium]
MSVLRKKPRKWGYWTKERVLKDALLYSCKSQWKENSKHSYDKARQNGWLSEATTHMTPKKKVSGYWTKEVVLLDAKRFNRPSDWENNSASAFTISLRNGWHKEATGHMDKSRKHLFNPLFLEGKKKCYKCKEIKNTKEFNKNKNTKDGLYPECKGCRLIGCTAWKRKNKQKVNKAASSRRRADPDKFRDLYLRNTYGITLKKYETMLELQNFVCAICSNHNGNRNMFVDHCHETGIVRGLLCCRCNFGISHFEDSLKIMA